MTGRLAAAAWVVIGIVVWNGFFDLYVSRGAREYLQRAAEAELGRGPAPSMDRVMAEARQAGATAASLWAVFVTGAGWITLVAVRRRSGTP